MSNTPLEDAQKRAAKLEAPALRAAEYIKSPEYLEEAARLLTKVDGIIGVLIMSGDEALIRIGRLQQLIETWGEPRRIILEYESVKQSLSHMLRVKA